MDVYVSLCRSFGRLKTDLKRRKKVYRLLHRKLRVHGLEPVKNLLRTVFPEGVQNHQDPDHGQVVYVTESDASQKCLDINNYDKSMCSMYFQRYKNCRKYWHGIMVQRRRVGVRPDMPTAAEREEMLTALGGKPY
ncbi:coiled-coil-helix-coiled-coil-helix domain-containing protein 7-like [Cololabis saira]|uniref:coiled-coil-helix-coiled-coil-helix domain-containing protein 7-like n=1 Tax=Cololabis saira TaxID=129043 RepID=UPI002AD26183|nr:coiled-coil-helix-coiled-coil-helix domain-containing protein 7-like [Cololabis saira]